MVTAEEFSSKNASIRLCPLSALRGEHPSDYVGTRHQRPGPKRLPSSQSKRQAIMIAIREMISITV